MSNLLTDWRQALVALLATSFPTAEVVSGEREGITRDKDKIAVFLSGFPEAREVNFANPKMTIRYWKARPKTALTDVLPDEEPLEQAAWDMMTTLQPVQTTLLTGTPGFYFRIIGIVPVRDEYAVEAHLLAWTRNPATLPL